MKESGHWSLYGAGGDLPIISTLGAQQPERSVFIGGFSLLAALLAALLIVRHRQLGREPALEHRRRRRRLALALGLASVVALLTMALTDASGAPHFIAALATFALLAIHECLHSGMCLELRRAPSGPRPWPSAPLAAWLLLCPAASVICVMLWLELDSARFQFAAVGLQFGYFLVLTPALALDRVRSTAPAPDAPPARGIALAWLFALSPLLLASLTIAASIDAFQRSDRLCDRPRTCWSNDPRCREQAVADDMQVVESGSSYQTFCPNPPHVLRIELVPRTRSLGIPAAWLVGTLALVVAFVEPPRERGDRRPLLMRAVLWLLALAVAAGSVHLFVVGGGGRRLETLTSMLLVASIVLAWLVTTVRADRWLAGRPARGFLAPTLFVAGALAIALAMGAGALAEGVNATGTAHWGSLGIVSQIRLARSVAEDALTALDVALLASALPLAFACLLAVARDLSVGAERARPRTWTIGAAAGLVAALAVRLLAPRGADDSLLLPLVSATPVGLIAVAILARRSLGGDGRLVLVLAAAIFDVGNIAHALRLRDAALASWGPIDADSIVVGALIRALVDLPLVAIGLRALAAPRGAPSVQPRSSRRVAAAGVLVLGAYGALVAHAKDLPALAVDRAARRVLALTPDLPPVAGPGDGLVGSMYRIDADGSTHFVDAAGAEPVVRAPRLGPDPDRPESWVVAADRSLTMGGLQRAIAPHGPLATGFLLLVSIDGPDPRSLAGDLPLAFASDDDWRRFARPARRERFAAIVIDGRTRLLDLAEPSEVLVIEDGPGRGQLEQMLCREHSDGMRMHRAQPDTELLMAVGDHDTVEQVARRIAALQALVGVDEFDDRRCGVGRFSLTRDRARLEALSTR
jgi:hypothetical protein